MDDNCFCFHTTKEIEKGALIYSNGYVGSCSALRPDYRDKLKNPFAKSYDISNVMDDKRGYFYQDGTIKRECPVYINGTPVYWGEINSQFTKSYDATWTPEPPKEYSEHKEIAARELDRAVLRDCIDMANGMKAAYNHLLSTFADHKNDSDDSSFCPRCNSSYHEKTCDVCGYPELKSIENEDHRCTEYRIIKMGDDKGNIECSECNRVYEIPESAKGLVPEMICNDRDDQPALEATAFKGNHYIYDSMWHGAFVFCFADRISRIEKIKTNRFNNKRHWW